MASRNKLKPAPIYVAVELKGGREVQSYFCLNPYRRMLVDKYRLADTREDQSKCLIDLIDSFKRDGISSDIRVNIGKERGRRISLMD